MSHLFSDLPAMLPPPPPDFPDDRPSFVRRKVARRQIEQLAVPTSIIAPDEHRENLARMADWKANAIRRAEEAARRAEEAARVAAIEAEEIAAKARELAERREAEEEIRRISAAAASRRKLRRCLSCGDDFNSHGPGNRICSPCKDLDGWKAGVTEFATVSAAAF